MINNEGSDLFEGKVVFWSGVYGFIQLSCGNSIFFHKNVIAKANDVRKMKVFYDVSFKKTQSVQPKHFGKTCAIDVVIIKKNKVYAENKQSFENTDLYLGVMSKLNNAQTSGYIENPQFEKAIKVFRTRNIFKKKFFQIGDVVVFNPVKSSDSNDDLFAFVAYHADFERSMDFLKSQASENRHPVIKLYVAERIQKAKQIISIDEEFEAKLFAIDFDNAGSNSYHKLKEIIEEFRQKSFFPKFPVLAKYCPDELLIRLFLEGFIEGYDQNILYKYFWITYADTKRSILQRLSKEIRIVFINKYYSELRKKNMLNRLTNSTKLLLDITHRNENTRYDSLYCEIKTYLIEHFQPNELIELWANNYIDSLSESFWKANFDENEPILTNILVKYRNDKISQLLERFLEDYLYHIQNLCYNFDSEHPKYIRRLLIYQNILKKPTKELEKLLQLKLNDIQMLTFWVFTVEFNIDLKDALESSNQLNEYYRVRFFLRYKELSVENNLNILPKTNHTQTGLIHFINSYKWNQLVHPILPRPLSKHQFSFIDDIYSFANLNIDGELNAKEIAISLFHSMNYYSVYHLRLWLYDMVDRDFLNYIGFRTVFKELIKDEQYKFRVKANETNHAQKIDKIEIEEVKPCEVFVEDTYPIRVYNAYIENIYFGYERIKLRKEDKEYTEYFPIDEVSSGFNRIPSDDILNKMSIIINVDISSNKITNVFGMDDIITKIHTDEIGKALGTVIDDVIEISDRQAYAEDWELRKSILNYLEENHSKIFDKETVKEPRNFYRRLNEKSGIDDYSLTRLYTLDMSDGYAIVWEDIDLTCDRATYVFRATDIDYFLKINNIIEGISTLAQFRSTLSNQRDEQEELLTFRKKYGYVGSFRKNRGINQAFDRWMGRLEDLTHSSIPFYPTKEELEKLHDWKPNNPHTPRVGGLPPKTIHLSDIKTDKTGISPEGKNIQSNDSQKSDIQSLLEKIEKFNSLFLQGINI